MFVHFTVSCLIPDCLMATRSFPFSSRPSCPSLGAFTALQLNHEGLVHCRLPCGGGRGDGADDWARLWSSWQLSADQAYAVVSQPPCSHFTDQEASSQETWGSDVRYTGQGTVWGQKSFFQSALQSWSGSFGEAQLCCLQAQHSWEHGLNVCSGSPQAVASWLWDGQWLSSFFFFAATRRVEAWGCVPWHHRTCWLCSGKELLLDMWTCSLP